MANYEMATPGRMAAAEPAYMPTLRRLQAWRRTPERCTRCRTGQASMLRDGHALCAVCASPHGDRMRTALTRQSRITRELADEDRDGAVGLAVPFNTPAQLVTGDWETFARGAFAAATVPLTRGHNGAALGEARVFPLPHGLFFDTDRPVPAAVLRDTIGVSIEFHGATSHPEPSPHHGELRCITHATLGAVALIARGQVPVYRSTWCAAHSADAWRRVYATLQADFTRIVRGA